MTPAREARPNPEPSPPRDDEEWFNTEESEQAERMARGLVQYLEERYVETGHRWRDLADLIGQLLARGWTYDEVRAGLVTQMPQYRARFSRKRTVPGAILGDMLNGEVTKDGTKVRGHAGVAGGHSVDSGALEGCQGSRLKTAHTERSREALLAVLDGRDPNEGVA